MFGIGADVSNVGGRCPFAHAPMRPTPQENSASTRTTLSTACPAALSTGTTFFFFLLGEILLQHGNLSGVIHRMLVPAVEQIVKAVSSSRNLLFQTLVAEALDRLNQFKMAGEQ